MTETESARDRLMREDPHYRHLSHKHDEYEQRLAELRERRFLSEDEKLEEIQVKKLKLRVKDEMESILRQSDHDRNARA